MRRITPQRQAALSISEKREIAESIVKSLSGESLKETSFHSPLTSYAARLGPDEANRLVDNLRGYAEAYVGEKLGLVTESDRRDARVPVEGLISGENIGPRFDHLIKPFESMLDKKLAARGVNVGSSASRL